MNIGLLTTVWGRPHLTQVFLGYHRRLLDSWCAAVYAWEDPDAVPEWAAWDGWIRVYHHNKPLAAKWNAGAAALDVSGIDALLILGSDDFVTPAYIERITELLEAGHDYITPTSCYFYDQPTGRLGFAQMNRVGAGRVLARSLLEATDWQPWHETPRNPDYALGRRAGRMAANPASIDVEDAPLLDVKTLSPDGTSANVFSFDEQMRNVLSSRMVPGAAAWMQEHYSGLVDALAEVPVCP